MSTCRKSEIQSYLPKQSPKSKEFPIFFTNSDHKSLPMFILSCFNNNSIDF